jgi:hypothetical protein
MKPAQSTAAGSPEAPAAARMGAGSWTILTVLISLLAGTFVIVYFGWMAGEGTEVPTSGYVAMAIGVIFSLAVGFGLMALVFYSSRKGYDEPPVLVVPADSIKGSGRSGEPPER